MNIHKFSAIISQLPNYCQSEAQIVAAVYFRLLSEKLVNEKDLVLEKPYPYDNAKKCDMFIAKSGESALDYWIEFKGYFSNETPQTRSRKHTQNNPVKDIHKLSTIIDEQSKKIIVLYMNVSFNPNNPTWDEIESLCAQNNIDYFSCLHEQYVKKPAIDGNPVAPEALNPANLQLPTVIDNLMNMPERHQWILKIIHFFYEANAKWPKNKDIYGFYNPTRDDQQNYHHSLASQACDACKSSTTSHLCETLRDDLGLISGNGRDGWLLTPLGRDVIAYFENNANLAY